MECGHGRPGGQPFDIVPATVLDALIDRAEETQLHIVFDQCVQFRTEV